MKVFAPSCVGTVMSASAVRGRRSRRSSVVWVSGSSRTINRRLHEQRNQLEGHDGKAALRTSGRCEAGLQPEQTRTPVTAAGERNERGKGPSSARFLICSN